MTGRGYLTCSCLCCGVFFFLVEGEEKSCDPSQRYNVTWYLRYSDCYNEVFNFGVRIV